MVDFVQVSPDSTGKKVDAPALADGGGNTVQRQRVQLGGSAYAEIADVKATDPAASAYGLVTREAALLSPQVSHATVASLAAGASSDLDSANVNTSKTAKLLSVVVASALPFKARLVRVQDGSELGNPIVGVGFLGEWSWEAPHRDAFSVAHSATAGFDGFRVTVTNLDTGKATDGYASFIFDEV